jgi:transcription factor 1
LGVQIINKGKLDQWDYILRRLFVLKSTPLRGAISSLAPGAEVLLSRLTDKKLPKEQRVDIRLRVNELTISDWVLIARAFDAWPFAPEVRRSTHYLTRSSTNLLTGLEHRLFHSLRSGINTANPDLNINA